VLRVWRRALTRIDDFARHVKRVRAKRAELRRCPPRSLRREKPSRVGTWRVRSVAVDTIDDKQIAEFDAATSGVGDDEFSDCIHQGTVEGWEGRKAGTASEFIAIVIRRLKNRHRH
jgi:hypothetical protein